MLKTCIQTHISVPNHLVCSLNSTSMDYISEMFHVFLPSLFLIFLPYSVCKDGFTKTCEIRGPEGNGVPSIYRLTHVNFNSRVFVSFLRFFFLSLTPLHWRILYFPNAINRFFFLKQIGSVFFLPQINVQH